MKTAAALTAALIALSTSAEAREIDVAAGAARLTSRSASFDAVSVDDGWTLGAVEVAVEAMELPLVDRLHVELAYTAGSTSAIDFDQFEARLHLDTIHLGARATRLVSARVRAFVHADIGLTFGKLILEDATATATPIRDRAVDLSAFGGAGAEIAVFRFPNLDLGARVELGYFLSGDLAFKAEPDHPDDGLARLPTYAAELGSIDPSGVMARLTMVGRF